MTETPSPIETEQRERVVAALTPEVREALVMTGFRDLADLIDMANVGRSMMDRMAQVTADGPLKGWSPADDPAEIVTDLRNALDDALHDYGNAESECKMAEAALEEAEAQNTNLKREAEGRARADADYRKRWASDALFKEIDAVRQHCAGIRPGWSEALAEMQSRVLHRESALSALQQENARLREAALWCVHLRGPDDLVPVASYDEAVKACDFWLAEDRKNAADPHMPMISAIPAPWTFGADEHAKGLAALQALPSQGGEGNG